MQLLLREENSEYILTKSSYLNMTQIKFLSYGVNSLLFPESKFQNKIQGKNKVFKLKLKIFDQTTRAVSTNR